MAESLDFICAPQNEFLIIYYDYSPIYISFQITNLAEFLKSYAKEQKSLDITLFCLNRREVIDIFIEENDIESSGDCQSSIIKLHKYSLFWTLGFFADNSCRCGQPVPSDVTIHKIF